MKILFNGRPCELPEGATVAQLLERFELVPRRVAVEVNQQLAPRARHGEVRLCDGDQVEVVTLVGGG